MRAMSELDKPPLDPNFVTTPMIKQMMKPHVAQLMLSPASNL